MIVPKRVVIRGGHVLSMDPQIGDIYGGDVLIEDGRIAAVAPSIDAGDAEVIDAAGCIVIPGFIDSHRHTWETVIRGIAPDVSLAATSTSSWINSRPPIAPRTSTPGTTSGRSSASTPA